MQILYIKITEDIYNADVQKKKKKKRDIEVINLCNIKKNKLILLCLCQSFLLVPFNPK